MKKIRFGIVGTGRISDWVLRGAMEDPRFEAAAVCSRKEETAETFARAHGIAKTYTDLAKMAADPGIDAIYIGTPNHTHYGAAILCMEHGKHVLCEKPLGASLSQVCDMFEAARKYNVLLVEAVISTLNPYFRYVAEHLSDVGEVKRYFASYCQYSTRYDALKTGVVGATFNPACCGDALTDIGIYTLYPLVALFGRPSAVRAELKTVDLDLLPTPPGVSAPRFAPYNVVDIQGTVHLEYPGMNADVIYSKVADSYLPSEVAGKSGNFILDKIHNCSNLRFIPHAAPSGGQNAVHDMDCQVRLPSDVTGHNAYYHEFKHFMDCVEMGLGESPVNSFEVSRTVAGIMDEVRRAAGVRFPSDI